MRDSSWVWRYVRPSHGRGVRRGRRAGGGVRGHRPGTALIAREWGKPLEEWRYEDSVRTVPLVNPAWPILPIYMVPNVAASLLTTARDYARFLAHVVAAPGPSGLALGANLREAMTAPQVRLNSALAWGLGWGLQDDEYGQTLWHWGANNGFRNFCLADADNRRALVVLTNSGNGPRVYERVIVSLTGHDHPAFLRA